MDKQTIIARAKEEYQEFKKKYPYEGSTWTKRLWNVICESLSKDKKVLDFTNDFSSEYIDINYPTITISIYEKPNGQIAISDCVDIWGKDGNIVAECFKMN